MRTSLQSIVQQYFNHYVYGEMDVNTALREASDAINALVEIE